MPSAEAYCLRLKGELQGVSGERLVIIQGSELVEGVQRCVMALYIHPTLHQPNAAIKPMKPCIHVLIYGPTDQKMWLFLRRHTLVKFCSSSQILDHFVDF